MMASKTSPMKAPYIDLVEEVASKEGVSPLDLPPLYDVIDAADFDALTSRDSYTRLVTLTYCGYDVTVDRDGTISVAGAE